VQLVIELVETLSLDADKRLQPYSGRTSILGMDIPRLQLPISHVTNLAVLVETATKNHVLYTEGYDANASLAHRQQEFINKQPV
jgi:HPr kinase/phosphorylase